MTKSLAHKISYIIVTLLLVTVSLWAVTNTGTSFVHAGSNAELACEGISGTGCDAAGGEEGVGRLIGAVIEILAIIVGAASVIVILLAGFKFMTSAGDPNGIKRARDTLIYAVVGLAVAILTMLFVNFALGAASP